MIVDLKNLVPSVCGFYNLDLCHAATAASDHEMTLLYFLREMPQKDPCQKQACAIQKCLQANKYVESLCEDVIAEMRRCCQVHAGNSICCSGFKDSKPAESKSSQ